MPEDPTGAAPPPAELKDALGLLDAIAGWPESDWQGLKYHAMAIAGRLRAAPAAPPAEGEALRRVQATCSLCGGPMPHVCAGQAKEGEALRLAERVCDLLDRMNIYGPADALRDNAGRLVRVLRATQGEPAPSETHVEVALTHGTRRWQARIEQPATGRDWYHEIHQAIQRVLGEPAPSPSANTGIYGPSRGSTSANDDSGSLGSSGTGDPEARRHAEQSSLYLQIDWTTWRCLWPGCGWCATGLPNSERECELHARSHPWALRGIAQRGGADVQGAPSPASEQGERAKHEALEALVREWREQVAGSLRATRQLSEQGAYQSAVYEEGKMDGRRFCADALDAILKGER